MEYNTKRHRKFFLFLFAAFIAAASLLYSNYLVRNLAKSERTRAAVWAMSTRSIMTMPDVDDEFISFVYAVRDSLLLPAIITDASGSIIFWRGLDKGKTNVRTQADPANAHLAYDPGYFQRQLALMRRSHPPIDLPLDNGEVWSVHYRDSDALRQLRVFPYVQLSLVAIFLILAYTVFNSARRAEQNLVWVGMAKEAAHQLGTPISSLMGWLELVRAKFNAEADEVLDEMGRDVERLQIVADRFSKIGSTPALASAVVHDAVRDFIQYFRVRTSERIAFELRGNQTVEAAINVQLFDWILENLLKNAVNAIESEGKITVTVTENLAREEVFVDVSDTGKGIPRANYETVFQPGFTTRKRGWGLGLSLTKRMVDYHHGRIFVKESEIGKGTTFRVVLKAMGET